MSTEGNEVSKFVQYLEEDIDVLIKSQTKDQKNKKSEAADRIISKWKNLTGKTLDHGGLLKKINNLKSRAKTTQNCGKTLSEWQCKILELGGANLGVDIQDNKKAEEPQIDDGLDKVKDSSSKTVAEQILEGYETDETKLLSDEQLKRLVLLKQIKVLNIQQQRLESQVVAEKDVVFDFVGFDGNPM